MPKTTKRKATKRKESSAASNDKENAHVKAKITKVSSYMWPKEDPSERKFREGLLLYGQDQNLWNALAHASVAHMPATNLPPCQVFVRPALDLMGLGWVGTSTHPYRSALGNPNKYSKVVELLTRHNFSPPSGPLPNVEKVQVIEEDLSASAIFDGPFERIFDAKLATVQEELQKNGMICIRNAIPNLPEDASACTGTKKKLRLSTANGASGEQESYYADSTCGYWSDVQNQILQSFLTPDDFADAEAMYKAILLQYYEGGENWAHQDGDGHQAFPYQAVVILNNEFKGGEFYVAKAVDGGIVRRKVSFNNSKGDLVLFASTSASKYFHGMMKVTEGERTAVGLFQKN